MSNYASDEWLNGEQSLGGETALVRKNVSLSNLRRLDYPYELIVHLVYEELQDDGLPGSQEEFELLDSNEELIANLFCEQHDAKFALVVTSNGVRDQFLYLPRLLSDDEIANKLDALSLSVDYDFGIRKNSDWTIYSNALPKSGAQKRCASRPWWKKLFGSH